MNADRLLAYYEKIADAPDAVQRLRRFILDLAVRGKLVEQDPNDEPASELLKRIASEKARLVKAEVIRRPKVPVLLSGDELPFHLPRAWAWTQIAELGVISPRNDSRDDHVASFVPMPMIPAEYGATNVHEPRQWGEIKKGYTHFAEGDVGLAKITPCFENGKSIVFRNLTGGTGSGTTELHVVRPIFVDADYIVLFLKTPHFIETGIPRMTGTAGQKRVPAEYFANSPFPLPPLAEQHRIVAKVDELMALCDRLEEARTEREETRDRLTAATLARLNAPDPDPSVFRNHATLALKNLLPLTTRPDQIKALRQTILNLAVRGKLVKQDPNDEPASELLKRIAVDKARLVKAGEIKKSKSKQVDRFNTLFELPKSWKWATLCDLFLYDAGVKRQPKNLNQKLWLLELEDIEKDSGRLLVRITASERESKSTKSEFRVGDILYGKLRPYLNKVLVADHPGYSTTEIVALRPLLRLCPQYCALALRRPDFVDYVTRLGQGTKMPRLRTEDAAVAPFPLPPLAEQHRIVAKVDELMTLCDRLEASLASGDDTRRRLLDALLHEALAPSEEESGSIISTIAQKSAGQTARATQSADRVNTDSYVN